MINLIDTPGHVDFGLRGEPLARGVRRRRCSSSTPPRASKPRRSPTTYLALENDLEIVPVLNKLDLPAADPDRYCGRDGAGARHRPPTRCCGYRPRPASVSPTCSTRSSSASPRQTGSGRCAAPSPHLRQSLRHLPRASSRASGSMNGRFDHRRQAALHAGRREPRSRRGRCSRTPDADTGRPSLGPGEVGYLIAGIKDVREARSGETITAATSKPADAAARRVPRATADGVLRPVSGRRRRLRGLPRRRSTSSVSTTAASRSSQRPPPRSASGSAAGFSVSSTWRSSGSDSSASST